MRHRGIWIGLLAAHSLGCGSFFESGIDDPTASFDLTCSIPTTRLFDGGPGRDGIPALNNPDIAQPPQSGFSDATRVLGIVVNGAARAYPIPLLWYHEVINDRLGGQNVLVSYCPLTGSGIVFDPIVNGTARTFGVSGLIFENNLVMFDRESESLWNQLLLGAQCGPDRGAELQRIPVTETTLGHWRGLYPQTTVVTSNTGFNLSYEVYPYGDYADLTNDEPFFPSSNWDPVRPAKEPVLGVHDAGRAVAYPFGVLDDLGPAVALNDTLGPRPILVTFEGTSQTARAFDRTVNGEVLTFTVSDTAGFTFVDAETGSAWNASGTAFSGPLQGEQLHQLADAYQVFWFSWSVYHSATRLYQ